MAHGKICGFIGAEQRSGSHISSTVNSISANKQLYLRPGAQYALELNWDFVPMITVQIPAHAINCEIEQTSIETLERST
jgi:hypothetical protein